MPVGRVNGTHHSRRAAGARSTDGGVPVTGYHLTAPATPSVTAGISRPEACGYPSGSEHRCRERRASRPPRLGDVRRRSGGLGPGGSSMGRHGRWPGRQPPPQDGDRSEGGERDEQARPRGSAHGACQDVEGGEAESPAGAHHGQRPPRCGRGGDRRRERESADHGAGGGGEVTVQCPEKKDERAHESWPVCGTALGVGVAWGPGSAFGAGVGSASGAGEPPLAPPPAPRSGAPPPGAASGGRAYGLPPRPPGSNPLGPPGNVLRPSRVRGGEDGAGVLGVSVVERSGAPFVGSAAAVPPRPDSYPRTARNTRTAAPPTSRCWRRRSRARAPSVFEPPDRDVTFA